MRSFVKNIAAALAIVFFAAAFYIACEQQQKPTALSSPDWAPIDSSDSDLMPAALRVVPGRSWQLWRQSDSTFALLSQDTSGDGLESIVREDSLFAWLMTKLPDSLDLASYTDTLRVSNDTLYISGQETGFYIGNETFFVDDPTEIMDQAFALNRRIIVEPTGAQYVVKSTAVSGYTTDSVAVIPTGARFAQLQPDGGKIYFSHFNADGNDDTERIRKMMLYAAANKNISTVLIDQDAYLLDTLMIQAGVSLQGIYQGNRTRTINGEIPTLYIDLEDANKTAITTEDHEFGGGDQYFPGGTISNLNIEALSDGHTIFRLIRPGWMQIHTIRIGSGPTHPTNFSTRYFDYAFRFDDAIKTQFRDIEIRNCKKWAIWAFDGGGTTYIDNVRLDGNENGIKADTANLLLNNCIIENIDSVGLRAYGGDVVMTYTHFEDVPNAEIDVDVIQLGGGAGSLTMRSVRMGSPFTPADAGLIAIATDDFDFLFVEDCEFHNYPTQLSTTANQGQIFWQNEWTTGITNKVNEFTGVTDLTKFYFRNGSIMHIPGDAYITGLSKGLVGAESDDQLVSRTFAQVADSINNHIVTLLNGGNINSATTISLNADLFIDDPTAGSVVVIGNTTDVSRGIFQVQGGAGYATSGWLAANAAWFGAYNSGGTQVNLMRYSSSNIFEIGNTALNEITISAGTNSTRYINMNVGNADRVRIVGTGEVRIGDVTNDKGAEILQVVGDVYIDDVLLLKPTTAPGTPAEGMIYANASDHHLYFFNGTTWVQLDN